MHIAIVYFFNVLHFIYLLKYGIIRNKGSDCVVNFKRVSI